MLVLVNVGSGRLSDPAERNSLRGLLDRAELRPRVVETEDAAAMCAAVEEDTSEVVVAAGGDGTVSAIAGRLAGTDRKLGVIAGGTLNHFAKDLEIPLDFKRAVDLLRNGTARRVDIAEVNGLTFINNSSLGLYPEIVRQRTKIQRRGFRKWTAFAAALIATLFNWPLIRVRLEIEGRAGRRLTPFVLVGNNLYQLEGLAMGSRARIDEGRICLCVARVMSRFGLVRMAVRGLTGGLASSRDLELVCTREAWVKTGGMVDVALDGEVVRIQAPLHYSIRPGALQVIAP